MNEPLASCSIVHFSAHILKLKLVCQFGVSIHIFIIISCPWFTVSCMKLVIFYSIITFSFTKYAVQSYTVDVVFTLPYYAPSVIFQTEPSFPHGHQSWIIHMITKVVQSNAFCKMLWPCERLLHTLDQLGMELTMSFTWCSRLMIDSNLIRSAQSEYLHGPYFCQMLVSFIYEKHRDLKKYVPCKMCSKLIFIASLCYIFRYKW